jgi:DNA helicase HerA-like ATPase
MRDDGLALKVSVRSRTPEGAALFTEKGIEQLAWAIKRRVVLLPSNAYAPTTHDILVEREAFEVGDLPATPANTVPGVVRVLLGRSALTGAEQTVELWRRERGSVHALVAGTTGGGKSNTVNVLLTGLVANGVCVVGLDCKAGETLAPWSRALGAPFVDPVSDPDAAIELLSRLVEMMEQRQRCPGPNYRPIVLIVEEWASLPAKPSLLGDLLDRLSAQGRSASIGLILTTQRPTSNVGAVRTSTRGNLTLRIAHTTVGDHAASEAILGGGEYGAAELPDSPPGHVLVRAGGRPEHVRVFRCSKPDWKDGPPLIWSLDEVQEWDKAAQHEVRAAARTGAETG